MEHETDSEISLDKVNLSKLKQEQTDLLSQMMNVGKMTGNSSDSFSSSDEETKELVRFKVNDSQKYESEIEELSKESGDKVPSSGRAQLSQKNSPLIPKLEIPKVIKEGDHMKGISELCKEQEAVLTEMQNESQGELSSSDDNESSESGHFGSRFHPEPQVQQEAPIQNSPTKVSNLSSQNFFIEHNDDENSLKKEIQNQNNKFEKMDIKGSGKMQEDLLDNLVSVDGMDQHNSSLSSSVSNKISINKSSNKLEDLEIDQLKRDQEQLLKKMLFVAQEGSSSQSSVSGEEPTKIKKMNFFLEDE